MSYEENLQKKLQEQKKRIEEARKQRSEEREAEKDKKALTKPSISMHKLNRLILSEDQLFFVKPLHNFDLSWDVLVHTHKSPTASGKERLNHVMCTDPFEENSCKWCMKADEETTPKELGGAGLPYSLYDARHLKAMVMYVYNTVGTKRTFTAEDGEEVTYYLNPVQVVEIQADGSGKDKVLTTFNTFNKNKMFENVIWGVRREPHTMVRGKKKAGPFAPVETFTDEELLEKIGREGIDAGLPEQAQKWVDEIKSIKDKSQAKDEIFRYIITSFDNADEIAKLKRIELPKKAEKPEKATSELLLS